MKQRIFTGLIAGAFILLILLSNTYVISITVAVVSLFALYELYNAIGFTKKVPLMLLGFVFAILITFGEKISVHYIMPVIFAYVVFLFITMLIYRNKITLSDISVSFFLIVYVVYTMAHIVFVRNLPLGRYNIFLIFIGACSTDICAYFIGVLLGRRKLCPEISPKKTIEGAIGGLIGAVVFLTLMGVVVDQVFKINVNYPAIILLGFLCGLFAQLGDLSASIVKRQYEIKDYGNILPGHGGIMDRLDSIIFVAPLVYYFLYFMPIFG